MHLPQGVGFPELLVVLTVMILFLNPLKVARRMQELVDAFRGGPPPPSHPIPGNDSALVNRRSSRMRRRWFR